MERRSAIQGIVGLVVAVAGGSAMTLGPELYPDYKSLIFWASVGVVVLGLLVMFWPVVFPIRKQTGEVITMGDNFNNLGNNFGHMGPVNNFGPTQRRMDQGLKTQILAQLPKGKQIDVVGIMGDAESLVLAQEIHAFMNANGFNVGQGISQSVFSGPVIGLQVDTQKSPIQFVVGSAPR